MSKSVLVIGDVIGDKYVYGSVHRISPEAPVPVLSVAGEETRLGGAANVCNNLASLESNSTLIGFLGADSQGDEVENKLASEGIRCACVRTRAHTITKTRVVSNGHQIVRIDKDNGPQSFSTQEQDSLKEKVLEALPSASLVVISDYNKGVCSPELCQLVITEATRSGLKVIVDPKGHDWGKYHGAFLISPNVKELSEVYGRGLKNSDEEIAEVGSIVRARYGLEYLLVTRSEHGMMLIGPNSVEKLRAKAKAVFDVSGAGDTVVACLVSMLVKNHSVEEAAFLANIAGGIVVGKPGTATVSLEELSLESNGPDEEKVVTLSKLLTLLEASRAKKKRIVFTNGCFDILHKGHVSLLQQAKKQGDLLIVGINSDDSVKRLKGPTRPVNASPDRAAVLAGLDSVDYVVEFTEDTPRELIRAIRPNLLVKGGDYHVADIVGREFADETIVVKFVDGYSTTQTLARANKGQ